MLRKTNSKFKRKWWTTDSRLVNLMNIIMGWPNNLGKTWIKPKNLLNLIIRNNQAMKIFLKIVYINTMISLMEDSIRVEDLIPDTNQKINKPLLKRLALGKNKSQSKTKVQMPRRRMKTHIRVLRRKLSRNCTNITPTRTRDKRRHWKRNISKKRFNPEMKWNP